MTEPALLERGEIHIWKTVWDPSQDTDSASLLSEDELKHADRFVQADDRARYSAFHATLRRILGRYLRMPPETLKFGRNAAGKPFLKYPESNLKFNVSDSRGLAIFAFTADTEIGVDVEYIKPSVPALEIVNRFFSFRERSAFNALPASSRLLAFYRGWTRKEAYIKALGEGLFFSLHRFSVSFDVQTENCLLEVDDMTSQPHTVISIDCPSGYEAALASRRAIRQLRYFTFEFR